jgi:hypothetical protein
MNKTKVAIIGGGIAGSSVAIYLSKLGIDITLFEKEDSLVSGPPMCHLHAGGNLYPEISTKQCITLLKQSIELLRFYPDAIDYRPTTIVLPKDHKLEPQDLLPRLNILKKEYEELIKKDPKNEVLGKSSEYFKLFTRNDMEALKEKDEVKEPKALDEWMIIVAKNLEFDKVKFPILIVQEYGLNLFRISASAKLLLEKSKNVNLLLNTDVKKIDKKNKKWLINGDEFDYLINAAGFKSGIIDDIIGLKRDRLVEFKAAYVTKWEESDKLWPEIIFYGERGTPQGMGQFTPYPNGFFQLHGMTKDITLFNDGLVKSTNLSSQPKLSEHLLKKIEANWEKNEVEQRTKLAIKHISKFIPSFKSAKVASKPLYGAQQIPGTDATLRASEVSFDGDRYARCETVKASSVLTMARAIAEDLYNLELLDNSKKSQSLYFNEIKEINDIQKYAQEICIKREYPSALAGVNITRKK